MNVASGVRVFISAGVFVGLLVSSGCTSVSPMLLQLPAADAGTAAIPLKVGVAAPEKQGSQQISNIKTFGMLGIYQFGARMPRRSEVDYVGLALGDFLRDKKVFSYCYNEPFSSDDVDLLIRAKIRRFATDNSILGTTVQNVGLIPAVGLFALGYQLLGLPAETFSIDYDMTIVVETPAGERVAEYPIAVSRGDSVSIYAQPFGNYMWYDSVFQQAFFEGLESVRAEMVRDADKFKDAIKK